MSDFVAITIVIMQGDEEETSLMQMELLDVINEMRDDDGPMIYPIPVSFSGEEDEDVHVPEGP